MRVKNSIISEYPIGILWNMGSKYAKEMMLKIAIMEDVIQVRVLNLKDKYDEFVLDCYQGDEEAFEEGYIYDKIKNMKSDSQTIVAFILKIDNPTYKITENGKKQCIEARKIKQKIRDEYAPKVKGYFFDNLIHMSDNVDEIKRTFQVLNKYDSYTIEDYVRKGYISILKKKDLNDVKKDKTYIELLKGLKDEDYEK